MSKRRLEYEIGIERICDYLQIILKNNIYPTEHELWDEVKAIHSFRPIDLSIRINLIDSSSDQEYIFLLNEQYTRYDDVLPDAIEIRLVPASFDHERELYLLVTSDQTR